MTNKRQKEYYKEKTRYWITTIDDFEDTPYTCAVIDETCRLIKLMEAHPELAEEEYVPSEEFLEQAKVEEAGISTRSENHSNTGNNERRNDEASVHKIFAAAGCVYAAL